MRILFITDYLPYPPISGDRIRTYNLVRRIASQHEVWLAAPIIRTGSSDGLSHLKAVCCGVETANLPQRHKSTRLLAMLRYVLTGKPWEFEWLYCEELAAKIKHLVSIIDFDIVQIEHSRMAPYVEILPADMRSKLVLVFHNLASVQYERIARIAESYAESFRAWLHGRFMRRWEPRYAERFDRCITMSKLDRDLLIKANPRLVADVVPNGVDTHLYREEPFETSRPTLLFIGSMDYPPCADAARYLCNRILPHLRRNLGQIDVWIVGRDPSPELTRLSGQGVHVTGFVTDVIPYYRRSTVCVVPLRAGGGTRVKILEAMALGRPVVTTPIGCEGLNVVNNQHLLVADTPEQFSECVIRLLRDPGLYKRITANARRLVEEQYDWDRLASRMLQIYEELYR